MNHDYAHCMDYNVDCPEECFRGQLVKELRSSNQCMTVSWMRFKGTDECMKERKYDCDKNNLMCQNHIKEEHNE